MKMVVAYVDGERFEQIREDLLALGFLSLSVSSANGSVPEPTLSATYAVRRSSGTCDRRSGSNAS